MVKVKTFVAVATLGLGIGVLSPIFAEESSNVHQPKTILHVKNPFMDILGKGGYIGVILKSEDDNTFISRCQNGKVINEKYNTPEKAYNAILSKCI